MFYTTFLLWASLVAGHSGPRQPQQLPATDPVLGQITSQGCFESQSETASLGKVSFLSAGPCWELCRYARKPVMLLHKTQCFCADTYPSRSSLSSLTDDNRCNWPCPGYNLQACGGADAYSVFHTGLDVVIDHDKDNDSEASSDPSSSAPTTTADPDQQRQDPSDSTLQNVNCATDKVTDIAEKFVNKIEAVFKKLVWGPEPNEQADKTDTSDLKV